MVILKRRKSVSKNDIKKNKGLVLVPKEDTPKSNVTDLTIVKTLKDTKKEEKSKLKEVIDKATLEELEWREREVARVFKEGKKKVGQPTRLTEQLIQDLEVLARIGLSEKAMCESVMLPPDTFYRWKKRNKSFSERLMKARNTGKSKLINSLFGHGVNVWQSHAWLLERCFREEFGQNQKVELTGKDSGPLLFKVVYEEKKETL